MCTVFILISILNEDNLESTVALCDQLVEEIHVKSKAAQSKILQREICLSNMILAGWHLSLFRMDSM